MRFEKFTLVRGKRATFSQIRFVSTFVDWLRSLPFALREKRIQTINELKQVYVAFRLMYCSVQSKLGLDGSIPYVTTPPFIVVNLLTDFYCIVKVHKFAQISFVPHLMESSLSPLTDSQRKGLYEALSTILSDTTSSFIQVGELQDEFPKGMVLVGKEYSVPLTVSNTSENATQFDTLLDIQVVKDIPQVRLLSPSEKITLYSGMSTIFHVLVEPRYIGYIRWMVHLNFESGLKISRLLSIYATSAEMTDAMQHEFMKPVSEYKKKVHTPKMPSSNIIVCDQQVGARSARLKDVHTVGMYSIPAEIRQLVKSKSKFSVPFTNDTFSTFFSSLLWIEEMQMETDIRYYDLENVNLKRRHATFELSVPGLAEKRPSVLYGDKIFVSLAGTLSGATRLATRSKGISDGYEYEGRVVQVEQQVVLLKFAKSFHEAFVDGLLFDVRFTFNRVPLRRAHLGLELLQDSDKERWTFPHANHLSRIESTVHWDKSLPALNQEQHGAVKCIVERQHGDVPFIIFGPPGTGKTRTMVESILQLHLKYPHYTILCMAPSNSACDVLLERLSQFIPKSKMVRINATSRAISDVSPCVLEYSCLERDEQDQIDCFGLPVLEEFTKYRIVVTTVMTSPWLYQKGLVERNNHKPYFDAIFIDECGHCHEPDLWAGVGCHMWSKECEKRPRLILAGDPRQLGPVIRSPLAKKLGLGCSFIERLVETCDAYKEKTDQVNSTESRYQHPECIVKLIRNYRSHPGIIELPSKLFYRGDLLACADSMERELFCRWEELPKQGFPIVFHGVEGADVREGNSPSWFNPIEAATVDVWVKRLLDTKSFGLKPEHIGVIAPYRKQVQKLRQLFAKGGKGREGIKVGSVEEFQGQERRVIIISTVRSDANQLEADIKFDIGFLSNPKRFNVAVTRAKCLLIVVGNPVVLCQDPIWNSFIRYCEAQGGCTGCPPPKQQTSTLSIQERIDEIVASVGQIHLGLTSLPGGSITMSQSTTRVTRSIVDSTTITVSSTSMAESTVLVSATPSEADSDDYEHIRTHEVEWDAGNRM